MEKNYNYNFENRSKAKKTTVVSGNLLVFSCTASELKKNPVSDGRFWHTTDTNEFYYDWDGKRTKLNFTGDSDSINAEIAKIKADIAKLDPDAVQQKVDTLEGKVNTAVSTVNNLKADVNSAVSSANSASQAAQNAAAQVANKADVTYVDKAIADIELTPGPKGDKGDAFTYDDFTPEQLAALKGTDGKDGIDGQNGADGKDGVDGQDGVDGKSAFEIAKENGFVGTETEWLESLKGEGLSQDDKDLISSIPSDFSTGSFPENVDDESAQSEGYAKVQDVMKYVNALIQKKKDELAPSGENKDYIYINAERFTGSETPASIYKVNCYEVDNIEPFDSYTGSLTAEGQAYLNAGKVSGTGFALEVKAAPEIYGYFDEVDPSMCIYSELLTIDIPQGYTLEVHNFDEDHYSDASEPFAVNFKGETKKYGKDTYNSYVRGTGEMYGRDSNIMNGVVRYLVILKQA